MENIISFYEKLIIKEVTFEMGDSTVSAKCDLIVQGNTIETETGKNLHKTAERRKEVKERAPMYVKDVQPVKELKEETSEVGDVLEEEISKMKKMFSYNEKTQ
jgi:hypothetical protein